MQEEVTQKTVTFCVRTTKMTADVLKKVIAAYLRHQKQRNMEKKALKNQPKQGKITVKELAKQNAGMSNIEITPKNIKSLFVLTNLIRRDGVFGSAMRFRRRLNYNS